MTPEETLKEVATALRGRIANIEARSVPRLNYVLAWADARYIGFPTDNKRDPQIVGFERAAFFGDQQAAVDWLKSVGGIKDGTGTEPAITSAFNAKQTAIAEIEKALAICEGKGA